jgi:hypothetical protein
MPATIWFWTRWLPSGFSWLMVALLGMNAIGVMLKKSNPRTSCSPPMYPHVFVPAGARVIVLPVEGRLNHIDVRA